MGLTLSRPPGFSDLADSLLVANSPALGIELGKISENAAFGMVRTEVFHGQYSNGQTVDLPTSPIDGYVYSRSELIYYWTIGNSTSPTTHWISGKDSLFYGEWDVDQTTGAVASYEVYRRSGNHANAIGTNDGILEVWTVAQRQLTNLIMAAAPAYSAIAGASVALDKPLTQSLAQALNDDAKFAVVNSECFYLGDYTNGQTVTLPHSPDDGYAYSAAECKFMPSWRWTNPAASPAVAPPLSDGQLAPMIVSVNGSGVVSITIKYVDFSGNLNSTNDGRVSVFAFTKRSATPATMTPAATQFSEVSIDNFMPGSDLPFGTVQQIINNTNEALLTPEFFGPTTHANGDTIAVPTSAVDGHVFARSELQYLWTWSDTTNQTGTHLRIPVFCGTVNQSTGVVTLQVFRLPPGGPIVEDNDTLCRISVLIVARRAAHAASSLVTPTVSPQSDVSTGGNQVFDVPTVTQVTVNGSATAGDPNLSDTTPAAPANSLNVKWQNDTASPTDISAYISQMTGDSGSGGALGLVPAPAAGDTAAGKFLKADGTWTAPAAAFTNGALYYGCNGGGSVPATGGPKSRVIVPYDCTITGWTITADRSGSVQLDIKHSTYAGFPTTSSIVASAPPAISSAQKAQSSTLTGWTTALAKGDVLEFYITSITTIQVLELELSVTRSD